MKKILFGITTIILIAVAFYSGFWLGDENTKKCASREEIIAEIKDRLVDGGVINPESEEITEMAGIVQEVGEDYLKIIIQTDIDPFGDIFSPIIKILIDENTEIKKWELKDIAVFEKESEECKTFLDKSQECPSNQYIANKTTLDSVNPGNYLLFGKSENNIKGKEEFTVKSIQFSSEKLNMYGGNF